MKFPGWIRRVGDDFAVAALSDVGVAREENQDAFGVFEEQTANGAKERLLVVADGMGGHARGGEASTMAVDELKSAFFAERGSPANERLAAAIERANQEVLAHSRRFDDGEMMGTTLTALAVVDGAFWIGHVGDSRAYRIDAANMAQLTRDHTFINEMIREGILTEEEAKRDPRRHSLVQAVGIEENIRPDIFQLEDPESGSRFLLCSDGLAVVAEPEIAAAVRGNDFQQACEVLVEAANRMGGPDNVTVIVAGVR
jgi:protein phosphatase